MINSEDCRLDGINEPGARNIWVLGDDLSVLDREIKELHPNHSYDEIATILNVPSHLIAKQVRHLIRSGEIHSKHESGRTGRRRT